MDENLEISGNDFWYAIKTYRNYEGSYEFDEEGNIIVKIWYKLNGIPPVEKDYKAKTLGKMSSEQIREFILDCLCLFDKRIDDHNLGKKKL